MSRAARNSGGPAEPAAPVASGTQVLRVTEARTIEVGTAKTAEEVAGLCPAKPWTLVGAELEMDGRSHDRAARALTAAASGVAMLAHRYTTYGSTAGGKRSASHIYVYARYVT